RGLLDAAFDFSNVTEILIEPRTIGGRQRLLQRRHLADDGIEQAHGLLTPGAALGVAVAVAKQLLEDNLRVVLHRQRRRRVLPRDRVSVGAAQSVTAAQR